jgi:hypothetical protein
MEVAPMPYPLDGGVVTPEEVATAGFYVGLVGAVLNTGTLMAAVWTGWSALQAVKVQREDLKITQQEMRDQRIAQQEQAQSQAAAVKVARLQLLADAEALELQRLRALQGMSPAERTLMRSGDFWDRRTERIQALIDEATKLVNEAPPAT